MTLEQRIEKVVIESAERIVIDYANLSGREDTNRAEFRKRTQDNLRTVLKSEHEASYEEGKRAVMEEVKKDTVRRLFFVREGGRCCFGLMYEGLGTGGTGRTPLDALQDFKKKLLTPTNNPTQQN